MFKLFKKKSTPKKDSEFDMIAKTYNGMNQEMVGKMFYGDATEASRILSPLRKVLFGDDAPTEEQFQNTAFFYTQMWIRKHGGLSPEFSTTDYIKEAMVKRFSAYSQDTVIQGVDLCLDFLYSHEPSLAEKTGDKDNKESSDTEAFDAVMKKITSGLTGDSNADLVYLKEQCEAYKNHEMGKEIVRGCGRLMFNLIPDNKKAGFIKAIENDEAGTKAILEESRFNVYKKDYNKALSIIEPLVIKFDETPVFEDDQVSEYHIFDETFEEALYEFMYKPEKEVRHATLPLTEVYYTYGSLLVEMRRLPEAQEALKKALRWNPVSFRITAEYIETYKMIGDLDSFFRMSIDAFKIAIHPQNVARCYRNLGYYFVEKELYSEAVACYLLSLQYEKDSKQVQSELYYINTKTEGKVRQPSLVEARQYAEKYGFPIGPDDDVAGLAYIYGKHLYEEKATEAAKYFLNIAYGLIPDPEVKGMIDNLNK